MQALDHRGFSPALLSLRGIAASMVLAFHASVQFMIDAYDPANFWGIPHGPTPPLFFSQAFLILMNGHAAVTFFFVHSGFVLALSLDRQPQTFGSALGFYVRRLFRLWPMIIASCTIAALYQIFLLTPHTSPLFGSLSKGWFAAPMSLSYWLQNITLETTALVTFLWSLQIEVWGSLLMPFLYLIGRRVVPLCLLLLGFYTVYNLLPDTAGIWRSFASGLTHARIPFLATFLIGIGIGHIGRFLPRFRLISPTLAALLALPVLLLARVLEADLARAVIIEAFASAVIIYAVYYHEEGALHRFCCLAPIKFLGEISYSLYVNALVCTHFAGTIIVSIVAPAFIAGHGLAMNLACILASFTLAVPLSWLTYRLIERPFLALGKRLSYPIGAIRLMPLTKAYAYVRLPGAKQ